MCMSDTTTVADFSVLVYAIVVLGMSNAKDKHAGGEKMAMMREHNTQIIISDDKGACGERRNHNPEMSVLKSTRGHAAAKSIRCVFCTCTRYPGTEKRYGVLVHVKSYARQPK
jgi:hypothetical protein